MAPDGKAWRRSTLAYLRDLLICVFGYLLVFAPWVGPLAFIGLSLLFIRAIARRQAVVGRPRTARAAVVAWFASGLTFEAAYIWGSLHLMGKTPHGPLDFGFASLALGGVVVWGWSVTGLCAFALINGWMTWGGSRGTP